MRKSYNPLDISPIDIVKVANDSRSAIPFFYSVSSVNGMPKTYSPINSSTSPVVGMSTTSSLDPIVSNSIIKSSIGETETLIGSTGEHIEPIYELTGSCHTISTINIVLCLILVIVVFLFMVAVIIKYNEYVKSSQIDLSHPDPNDDVNIPTNQYATPINTDVLNSTI
jgi:hypothetical protein